ncbi:DUF192 domain-containing protein [Candidatus Woesearchaeota archaeon]|nr:DUF192 domain-containing protein [Candidatus Woesearchaeota archaeon]
MRICLCVIMLLLLFMTGCNRAAVEINGREISAEIADTPEERNRGLMFRKELCDNCGMLFVFEEESRHAFWMKDTQIPLDMVHIDSEKNVVDVLRAEPCKSDQCPHYIPASASRYVLEVSQGTFGKDNIGRKAVIIS